MLSITVSCKITLITFRERRVSCSKKKKKKGSRFARKLTNVHSLPRNGFCWSPVPFMSSSRGAIAEQGAIVTKDPEEKCGFSIISEGKEYLFQGKHRVGQPLTLSRPESVEVYDRIPRQLPVSENATFGWPNSRKLCSAKWSAAEPIT